MIRKDEALHPNHGYVWSNADLCLYLKVSTKITDGLVKTMQMSSVFTTTKLGVYPCRVFRPWVSVIYMCFPAFSPHFVLCLSHDFPSVTNVMTVYA